MEYRPPSFRQPQEYGVSLDGIFDAYLKNKAEKEGRTRQDFSDTVQYGTPISGLSPEQLERGAQGPTQGPGGFAMPGTMIGAPQPTGPQFDQDPHVAAIQRFIQNKRQSTALGQQEQVLGMDKTRSEIKENEAQALKLGSEAAMEAAGGGTKRPTATEFTARGFADKARQANAALESVQAGGFNPSKMTNLIEGLAPVGFQSAGFQKSDQARRQFVNAVLRRESGAAIPPSELENYTRQYFPVPGDSDAVKAQKAESRKLAIAGLESEGSRVPSALTPYGGGRKVGRFIVEE